MELDQLHRGLEVEFLLHSPILEDRMLQSVSRVVVVADEIDGALLSELELDPRIRRRSGGDIDIVISSKVEIWIRRLHSDPDVSSCRGTASPEVATLIDSVRIQAYKYFDIAGRNHSLQHPVVHRVQSELSLLVEIAPDRDLRLSSDIKVDELAAGIDTLCDRDLVSSWNSVIDIDPNEIPAGIAIAAIDLDDPILSLAHIECSVRVILRQWNSSVDVVVCVCLARLLVHHSGVAATFKEGESDLEVSMIPVIKLVDFGITNTLLGGQVDPFLGFGWKDPFHC